MGMIRVRVKKHASNVIYLEVLLGLYSDEAYRALSRCFMELTISRFCKDPVDGLVGRSSDGEIMLLAEWSMYNKPFSCFWPDMGVSTKQAELRKIPGCLGVECSDECPHYWECVRAFWEANARNAIMLFLTNHGAGILERHFDVKSKDGSIISSIALNSTLSMKELDIYYGILSEWGGEPKQDNSALVGAPLDAFRLASIATLRAELDRLQEICDEKLSHGIEPEKEYIETGETLRKYREMMGADPRQTQTITVDIDGL